MQIRFTYWISFLLDQVRMALHDNKNLLLNLPNSECGSIVGGIDILLIRSVFDINGPI